MLKVGSYQPQKIQSSHLKSSFPKLKNTWQNFPTQTNPEIENFKPPKILRSSLSLGIMRSTHPSGHRKLLMSSSRPTPLVPCRHSLFQAFRYWSAVRSRRAGKKNKEDERAVTPNHTPSLFFLLTSLSPRKRNTQFHSLSIASRFL